MMFLKFMVLFIHINEQYPISLVFTRAPSLVSTLAPKPNFVLPQFLSLASEPSFPFSQIKIKEK